MFDFADAIWGQIFLHMLFFEFEREPSARRTRLPIEVVALMNQDQSLRIKVFESRVSFMQAAGTLSRRIAAPMMVVVGLSLTVVWIAFLGWTAFPGLLAHSWYRHDFALIYPQQTKLELKFRAALILRAYLFDEQQARAAHKIMALTHRKERARRDRDDGC